MTHRCGEYLSVEQILFVHINLAISELPSSFVLQRGSMFNIISTNKVEDAEGGRERAAER